MDKESGGVYIVSLKDGDRERGIRVAKVGP